MLTLHTVTRGRRSTNMHKSLLAGVADWPGGVPSLLGTCFFVFLSNIECEFTLSWYSMNPYGMRNNNSISLSYSCALAMIAIVSTVAGYKLCPSRTSNVTASNVREVAVDWRTLHQRHPRVVASDLTDKDKEAFVPEMEQLRDHTICRLLTKLSIWGRFNRQKVGVDRDALRRVGVLWSFLFLQTTKVLD